MSAKDSPPGEPDSSTDAESKEFSCDYCTESYDTQGALNSHIGHNHPGAADKTVECDACGSEITRTKGNLKNRDNVFCNKECLSNYRSESGEYRGKNHPRYNRITVECSYCGEQLERIPARIESYENQYCDSECYGKHTSETGVRKGENNPAYNSITKECVQCGDAFTAPVSVIDAGRKFCGEECAYQYISETYTGEDNWAYNGYYEKSYGEDWQEIRSEVRDRDGYKCQVCGISEEEYERELDVHHIIPLRKFDSPGDANELDNLVSLCMSCHKDWEGLCLRPDTR